MAHGTRRDVTAGVTGSLRGRLRGSMSRLAVPAALALACGVLVASGQPVAIKVIGVIGLMVAAVAWTTIRELRVHAAIGRLSAAGRPDDLLALIDHQLAGRSSRRMRAPLLIYRAGALWMKGEVSDALAALDEVEFDSLRPDAARTWRFLYHAMRFTCLVFAGRLDEARGVLADHIEPFAEAVPGDGTRVILLESRAKLAFFEDRADEARQGFAALAADDRITPAARAMYHYFLGRLALAGGDADDAELQFERAVALAPEPFWTAEIAAMRPLEARTDAK